MARVVLVEASPRAPATGVVVPQRLAGGGRRHYTYRGRSDWIGGVIAPIKITSLLGFDASGFTGGAIPSTGAIGFMPSRRGATAALAALDWVGAAVSVTSGDDAHGAPAFTTDIVGTIAGYSIERGVFAFTLSDMAGRLAKPLVTATFAGTGGIEGVAEATGRVKRRSWGRCWNVEGRLLDKANSIWEFGDPAYPIQGYDQVKDKGRGGPLALVAWAGSIDATLAALRATAAPANGAAVAPSINCVKWWTTSPSGPLTADLRGEVGAGYVETVAAIASRVSLAAGGAAMADLAALDAIRPDPAGVHVDDASETGAAVLDRLLLRASLAWGIDGAGRLEATPIAFADPVETVVATTIEREAAFAPATAIEIGYRRNHRRHSDAEISAAVLAEDVTYADGTPIEALKPAEQGATDGAPAGSNIGGTRNPDGSTTGGKDASDVLKDIADAKARQDELVTVTIPAVEKSVADGGVRITDARGRADDAYSRAEVAITSAGNVDARVTREVALLTAVDESLARETTAVEARLSNNIAASARDVTTAFTDADRALGSRTSVLEASASGPVAGSLNPNPSFSGWTDEGTTPDGWAYWSVIDKATRIVDPLNRGGYAVEHTPTNVNSGIVCGDIFVPKGWYVMEAIVRKTAGSWAGAGVTLSGQHGIDFNVIPDTAGVVGDAPDGVRAWSFLFQVRDDFIGPGVKNWHAMSNWTGFAGALVPKTLWWMHCALRPASQGEIEANKATNVLIPEVAARVKTTEDTLADLPNRYAAASRTTVLEAQINRQSASPMNDALVGVANSVNQAEDRVNARIETRATAIADEKAGAVAQTVENVRVNLGGRIGQVEQQTGAIAGIDGRTSVYWRVTGTTNDGQTIVQLSKSDGQPGVFYVNANMVLDGNLLVTGSVATASIASNAVSVMAYAVNAQADTVYSQARNPRTLVQSAISVQSSETLLINVNADFGAAAQTTAYLYFRLLRDGVVIFGPQTIRPTFFSGNGVTINGTFATGVIDQPGPGAHTYALQLYSDQDITTWTSEYKIMTITALKR